MWRLPPTSDPSPAAMVLTRPLSGALLYFLLLATHSAAELRLTVYSTTAFGGPVSSNGTTTGAVSGATTVGCNQSAEYTGSMTPPPGATLLGFAADVDSDVSTLRVWVAEFLVLEGTTGPVDDANPTAKLWYLLRRMMILIRTHKRTDFRFNTDKHSRE